LTSLPAPIVLRGRSGFFVLLAAAPGALLLGHLLPASGLGLALRIAGAVGCVLLVPGAVVLRALGWSAPPATGVVGAFAVSLAMVAVGLGLVFLFGTSIVLAELLLLGVVLVALLPAARRGASAPSSRTDMRALAVALGLSVLYAGVMWWAARPVRSDGLFHLARIRKLAEFDSLSALTVVDEFKDGGLHPGYVFPLWQGVEAILARLAGVDPAELVLYLPAILIPLAMVIAYAAGSEVFRSPFGGLAFVLAEVAYFGFFSRDQGAAATGRFDSLGQPRGVTLIILATAVVALMFAYTVEGGRLTWLCLAAASVALSVIHISYAPIVALLVAGFLAARAILIKGWEPLLSRAGAALGAIVSAFALVLAALLPELRGGAALTRSAEQNTGIYGDLVSAVGHWTIMSPGAIARGGALVVAGLLVVPLAALASTRLWAALVIGGTLALLFVLLVPPVFSAVSDVLSLSQARRLPWFLPIPFALVGGSILLSRFGAAGALGAAGLGTAFLFLFPGSVTYAYSSGGPGWAVWVALAGGIGALVVGARKRRKGPDPDRWAVGITASFIAPFVVAGFIAFDKPASAPILPSGLGEAVRDDVEPGAVVFSDPETAYELAAYAPVYINDAPSGHAADTVANRLQARRRDTRRFFQDEGLSDVARRAILSRWQADWLLVDTDRPAPEEFLANLQPVYEDGRFALYDVGS
jgi:hypothetical protein